MQIFGKSRGALLALLVVGSALLALPAAAATKVRVGYIHVELVDVPLFHGLSKDYFRDRDIDLELVKFDNGTQINQALAGGRLDAALAGAGVIQNFAVQGHGVVFAFSYIDQNELYGNPALGVKSVRDLAGKQVAFPLGTTAHVLVNWALEDAGMDASSIKQVNTSYGSTAAALISGAVPAAVTFGAYSRVVNREKPDFVKLIDLRKLIPARVIFGGFVATNEFHKSSRATLVDLTTAYIKSYEEVWRNENAQRQVWEKHYAKDQTYQEFRTNIASNPTPPSPEQWFKYLEDGSVAKWALDVASTLNKAGALKTIGDPKQFLDPTIYKEAYQRLQSGK